MINGYNKDIIMPNSALQHRWSFIVSALVFTTCVYYSDQLTHDWANIGIKT